ESAPRAGSRAVARDLRERPTAECLAVRLSISPTLRVCRGVVRSDRRRHGVALPGSRDALHQVRGTDRRMTNALLTIEHLGVESPMGRRRPPLRAVDDVSLTIQPEETVGLVGESGSGKTTIASAVLGLVPVKDGTILFSGEDITQAGPGRQRRLSASLQVIFQ